MHSVPRRGAWAVMAIDPLESLEHLDDRHVPAICAGLLNKQYVVYVTERKGKLFNPLIPYHEHTVEFLMQGLPDTVPYVCVDSTMSIPVFPATKHPLGRAPLRPSMPLPWPNSYLWPFITANVRCETLVDGGRVPYQLDIPEQLRHDAFVEEDTRRREEGLAFRAALPRTPSIYPSATSTETRSVCTSVAGSDDSDAECSSDTECSSSASVMGSVEALEHHHAMDVTIFRNAMQARMPPADMTTVIFTQDLSVVDRLNSPLEFFAEQDTLKIIADDSRARREFAGRQTEWLDAENCDARTVRLLKRTRVLRVLSGIRERGTDALRRIFLPRSRDGTMS
ncbi:hypothetical protein B0H17DRAFT_1337250 [Mycena rosella]|uniref:Uncharacterized protein n=1 Tax=Mycena rosella TaxID=1033263 RepID=A0AAD7CSK0_MYCRO|nr:hypothetical protein B0H17DRAFT_1337250 [Mycena rosella]